MRRTMPWFKMDCRDWLDGTSDLDPDGRGIYAHREADGQGRREGVMRYSWQHLLAAFALGIALATVARMTGAL